VTDVEYFNPLRCLDNAIDHPIDMRFATEKQVSQLTILSRHRAPLGLSSQTEDFAGKAQIPFPGSRGIGGLDVLV